MTKLIYMDDFDVVKCEAVIERTEKHEGKDVIVLDQTCFYPKGGGQDFDAGVIKTDTAKFLVEAVFFVEGEVKHIGTIESGEFKTGDNVQCEVEQERRSLNTRLHSGGHVIDMAIKALGYEWIPGKGAHYPHMAFVEYDGEFNGEEKQKYIDEVQSKVNELVENGTDNKVQLMTPEEMKNAGAFVPENIPEGKPSRAVLYDDFIVPCGGTHVRNINIIGELIVKNIKKKDGKIRVSYSAV